MIGRGKLIAQSSHRGLRLPRPTENTVRVRSPAAGELRAGPAARERRRPRRRRTRSWSCRRGQRQSVSSPPPTGIVLHELCPQRGSLEEAFMQLTGDSVEYHTDLDAEAAARARSAK